MQCLYISESILPVPRVLHGPHSVQHHGQPGHTELM